MPFATSSDLSNVVRISFRSLEFRMDYLHFAVSILLPGFFLGELTMWVIGGRFLEMAVIVPAIALTVTFVGVLPFWWHYRYLVGPEGVEGYDFWGRRVRIASASVLRLFGFPYALLRARGTRTLWMPLSVNCPEALASCVHLQVAETHPVATAIRSVLR